jgi:hypothetical protein
MTTIQKAYCSACDKQVQVTWTPAPMHGGQATLPDGPELVCLDFGEHCTGELCPAFGLPRVLMGVRLARSGLKPEALRTLSAPCQACGQLVDLQIIDDNNATCPACGTTNRWVHLALEDGDYVALAEAP